MTTLNEMLKICLLILLVASVSHADDSHYINGNVGDRAADLAGAYTAISDDSSGCFYNPAGIVLAPSGKFSASVNAINASKKVYKDVLTGLTGNKLDWEQKSFSLLPNYFGIVQAFGPGMMGFSYAVPESVQMRQKQTFSNIQGSQAINNLVINLDNTDKAYLFGPSYSMKLSNSLSLGATLYYYYRDVEIITNQFIQFASGTNVIDNQYSTRTDNGIKPILGLMYEPVDNVSIGLAVSKLWLLDSKTEIQRISNGNPTPADFFFDPATSEEKEKYPLSTSLGVAWFYTPKLLFSCDLKYFEKEGTKQNVLNLALGTEYYPSDQFAVRAGLYTDMSNAPNITTSTVQDEDHIDIYGAALSGTWFSGKTSVSVGMDYSFGSGDSQPFGTTAVYKVDYSKLSVHISTSFSY